jgi:hypothetical protein
LDEASNRFKKLSSAFDPKIIIAEKLTTKNDSILKAFTVFRETLDKAIESINADKSATLISTLIDVQNNVSDKYVSLPYLYNGDEATVTVNIRPFKKDALLPSFNTKIRFSVFKKTYVGVSTGFFVTNMANKAYSVIGTSGTNTTYQLVNENPGKSSFGINALVSFGKQVPNCPQFHYHFSFGPGLAISDKISPRLFFAPGLSFGSKHLLSIDLGVTMGYTDYLSKAYSTDQVYSVKPGNVLVSRMNYGAFFSVGYIFNL